MRVQKEAQERKHEIIDAAEKLFFEKSYSKTTINDILAVTGIAKGTFYYYFKSKEDILDAIVERHIDLGITRAHSILAQEDLSLEEKFLRIILAQNTMEQGDEVALEELHKPENALMHQKSMTMLVTKLSPILAQIIEEGKKIGKFHSEYVKETIEIFLVAALNLFDDGVFNFTPEEKMKRAIALVIATERSLGAEPGSLCSIMQAFEG